MDFPVFKSTQHYFDHNATTPISDRVAKVITGLLSEWGNPSSIHYASRGPKQIIRETRQKLAEALNCSPLEIVFTSGGSEANNMILRGVWEKLQKEKSLRNEYITSDVEHPSVRNVFNWLEEQGAIVHRLKVSREGFIDLNQYKKVLSSKTALVSVMRANNETGQLFPIQEMAREAHLQGALFHSDCVQALGKISFDFAELGVDFATFSAHKFYSLKGSGFAICKKGQDFASLILGGGQERHRRGGTENTLAIGALGVMTELLSEVPEQTRFLQTLQSHFEEKVLQILEGVSITGREAPRLPNTSSLVIRGVDGETLLMSLDIKGYAVSTGAACSSGNPEPSPVLLSMGLSREEAQSSLRVSFGWENSLLEVDEFILVLKQVVERLRTIGVEEEMK